MTLSFKICIVPLAESMVGDELDQSTGTFRQLRLPSSIDF